MKKTTPDWARCYCDEIGRGEPGVSCGDCPTRDYPHMIAKTSAKRQAALKARRQAAGLKLVSVWVPAYSVEALKWHAEQLMRYGCKHGDPLCPCQDGLICHYEGPDAMVSPYEQQPKQA